VKTWKSKRENIFARNFRPFYPRSAFFFTQESHAKSGMITPNFSFFVRRYVFLSPLFVLPFAYKKSTKNRAKIIKKHSENETANTYALRQLARERRFSRKPSKISSKKSSAQRQRGMKIE
jgi:hypothetical protein